MRHRHFLPLLLLIAGLLLCASEARAKTVFSSGIFATPAADDSSDAPGPVRAIPRPLNASDLAAYRTALGSQERGAWAVADRQLSQVGDRLLVGWLLARRYLSVSYAPTAGELKLWMELYGDHPQAEEIYDLARRRYGALPGLRPPLLTDPAGGGAATSRDEVAMWGDFAVDGNRSLPAAERRKLLALKAEVRALVKAESLTAARAVVESEGLRKLADRSDLDEVRAVLARGYFFAGQDKIAAEFAERATEKSGALIPEAHWIAGLALWRDKRPAEALPHFEAVARSRSSNVWLTTAGAYWAARANLVTRHPEAVTGWLMQAANRPRNFYGILARRALGRDAQVDWENRPFNEQDGTALLRVPGGERALGLLQLGENGAAEDELRHLTRTAGPDLTQSMQALAHEAGLAGLAVRLGGLMAAREDRVNDRAAFPLPNLQPGHGWVLDKALVLAIIRQESDFNPHSRSSNGAVGLMQVIPEAKRITGVSGNLTDPSTNLDVGQRYLRYLMDDPAVHGNLLFLLAAFNTGPGSFSRWMPTVRHHDDPLLFIESIPIRGTHDYVQRVMTNLWAYRNRLGQDSPSLDALVSGEWPMYDETPRRQVAASR